MGSQFVLTTLALLVQSALLGLFPFVLLAALCRAVNAAQDAQLPWTPYVELASLCVGLLAGGIVLASNVHWGLLEPGEIFRKGGPWDMTFGQFLAGPANPFSYDVSAILNWPFSGRLPSIAGLIVLVLGGLVFYAPLIIYRSKRAMAHAIRNVIIVFWGAYTCVYLFFYLGWLANKLNFWIFLVLLIVIGLRRRSERVVLKIN